MKIIILLSSIFYILGLKISSKIDFVIKSPVEKIIMHSIKSEKHTDAYIPTDNEINEQKADSISTSAVDKNAVSKNK